MAIKAGLKDKRQVVDELSEEDFDPISWTMEQDAMFYGQAENAWFDYEKIDRTRNVNYPIYPKSYYDLLKSKQFIYPEKNHYRLMAKFYMKLGFLVSILRQWQESKMTRVHLF